MVGEKILLSDGEDYFEDEEDRELRSSSSFSADGGNAIAAENNSKEEIENEEDDDDFDEDDEENYFDTVEGPFSSNSLSNSTSDKQQYGRIVDSSIANIAISVRDGIGGRSRRLLGRDEVDMQEEVKVPEQFLLSSLKSRLGSMCSFFFDCEQFVSAAIEMDDLRSNRAGQQSHCPSHLFPFSII